jgi:hypothetical protein
MGKRKNANNKDNLFSHNKAHRKKHKCFQELRVVVLNGHKLKGIPF